MHAEDWDKQDLELEGWPVRVTCYRLGDSYLTQVESKTVGATVARATAGTREESRKQAIETAARRLARTRRLNLGLTVGG